MVMKMKLHSFDNCVGDGDGGDGDSDGDNDGGNDDWILDRLGPWFLGPRQLGPGQLGPGVQAGQSGPGARMSIL